MSRAKIEFDLKMLEGLASIHCTDEEIASVFGCSRRSVVRAKTTRKDFRDAYNRGRDKGKTALRRLQWQKADSGNVPMMIWLGKQWLGQADKAETKNDTKITAPKLEVIIEGELNT